MAEVGVVEGVVVVPEEVPARDVVDVAVRVVVDAVGEAAAEDEILWIDEAVVVALCVDVEVAVAGD